jgi:sugar lactone lactonase YvrE
MSPEVYLERYSGQAAPNAPVYALDPVDVVPNILHVHPQQQTMFVAEISRHTAYAVRAKSDGTLKGIILSPQPLAVKEGARKPSS